jgi:uncharacterized protein YgbK (DUF1537 family)
MSSPIISFYGDDFTGASENLAQYHAHGLRCRLYFEPADPQRVQAEAAELDVVGIAGVARSRASDHMRLLLRDAFTLLGSLGTRLNQYKICSTFDSAPEVGNFAVAIEEALRVWPGARIPVLPATPDFGRYTAFGNHFSRHRGEILRLDRNPALVEHPSTPMNESDLRLHLRNLGLPSVATIMLPDLAVETEELARLIEVRSEGGVPVILDTTSSGELDHVTDAIWQLARRSYVFCLAAQGLAQGLGRHAAAERGRTAKIGITAYDGPALVLSGSCATQSATQLAVAEAAGWALIRLPIEQLVNAADAARTVEAIAPDVLAALARGRSTAVYTARGGPTESFEADGAPAVGEALCKLFRHAVRHTGLRRAIFAGGDSSSFAMRASGAYALEIAGSTGRQTSHICRLLSRDEIDGVEVILKGGQAGGDRFYVDPLSG